jgi:hypothetical protein
MYVPIELDIVGEELKIPFNITPIADHSGRAV